MNLDFDLYFITDRALSKKGVIEDVKSAIRAGVRIVQYREKEMPMREMIEEAGVIQKICKLAKVIFIVNDRIDLALAVDADGVHLGPKDIDLQTARKILGKNKIIGMTASSLQEANAFEDLGADYVALSPVFATSTKKDAGKPVGVETLRQAKEKLRIPLVAIGGINFDNLPEVLQTGCDRVCMISALMTEEVDHEIKKARRIINEHTA